MMELTINGAVYSFNFGMGFLRRINSSVQKPIDGMPGQKQNIGLQYAVASVCDGDVEALVDMLDTANAGQDPRLTKAALDAYIDNPSTDVDGLFTKVLDFLEENNATRKVTQKMRKAMDEATEEAVAK